MTLIDPREALAEQSTFIGYLVGLVGIGQVVHTLAECDDRRAGATPEADDFVHLLVGLASIGRSLEKLGEPALPLDHSATAYSPSESTVTGWLR